MKPVLILNADMQPIIMPIHTIDAQQAINRIVAGTCYVVEHYDREIKTEHPEKLEQYNLKKWPSIIARYEYLHRPESAPLTTNNLFARDKGHCRYCGVKITRREMTIDHYIPRSKGGTNSWKNFVLACGPCNTKKGDSMPEGQWKLAEAPSVPTTWQLIKARLELPVTIYDEKWLAYLPPWGGPVTISR